MENSGLDRFHALIADGSGQLMLNRLSMEDLPAGEILIRVAYSGINYKDGLAAKAEARVVKSYPIVPGIDLAGTVQSSQDERFRPGDQVLVTGYGLGVSHFGGYAEFARVPTEWVVHLPDGLSLREAMIIGTAGFTAALSIYRLELNGLRPEQGQVLVTGASGGVGSMAVAILSKLGYRVSASTGKAGAHAYLRKLGAAEIVSREEVADLAASGRAMHKQRWAAAVDPVGGSALPGILGSIRYGGSAAVSGLTGGDAFTATVFPFILRGVNVLGIDSVECPMQLRTQLWESLAQAWKPDELSAMVSEEIALQQLPEKLPHILSGHIMGRTLVAVE